MADPPRRADLVEHPGRSAFNRPPCCRMALAHRLTLGRDTRALRPPRDDLRQPVRPLPQGRGVGPAAHCGFGCFGRRHRDDRCHLWSRPPARCDEQKKRGDPMITAWDAPWAASPARTMLSLMPKVVPPHTGSPADRSATVRKPGPRCKPYRKGATLFGGKGNDKNAIRGTGKGVCRFHRAAYPPELGDTDEASNREAERQQHRLLVTPTPGPLRASFRSGVGCGPDLTKLDAPIFFGGFRSL